MNNFNDIKRNPPYFDDYQESKKYHQILFRPSVSVQVRELNQLQTILQEQINRLGQHFFKEGSVVIPGTANFDTNYSYVKVYTNLNINNTIYFIDDVAIKTNFLGKTLVSDTGLKAKIVNYTPVDSQGVIRLYVKYVNSGTDNINFPGEVKKFKSSETILVQDSGIQLETHTDSNIVTGIGTGASVGQGVYFTNGFFVLVENQAIVVEPESQIPSVSIGLNVKIDFVTPEQDQSLLDNVTTSSNFSAPGAHRLVIDLILSTRAIDKITTTQVTDKDFIELVRLIDGIPSQLPNKTDYNLLEQELARRTFDESGNYTIKPFVCVAQEFFNDGTNSGFYTREMLKRPTANQAEEVGRTLLGTTGSHVFQDGFLPTTSDSLFLDAVSKKLVYQIDPGKAYVKGFEIERLNRVQIPSDKALDFTTSNIEIVPSSRSPFIRVTDVEGLPALAFGEFNTTNTSFAEVLLFSRRKQFLTQTNVPLLPGSSTVGTPDLTQNSPYCIGKARAIYWNFEEGSPGTPEAHYRLHLIDIELTNNDYTFEHIQSIRQEPVGSLSGLTSGFFSNVVQQEEPFLGANVSKPSGFRETVIGTGTYWKTLEYQQLGKNDCIVTQNNIFLYAVSSPLNNDDLLVDVSNPVSIGDRSISRLYTVLENQDENTLLFPIPKGFVKSIDESQVDYTTQVLFIKNVGIGNQITINLTQGIFSSYNETEWFFSKQDQTIIKPTSVNFPSSTQAEITFSSADVVISDSITSILAIRITDQISATPKTKTLRVGTYQNTGIPSGQYYVLTQNNQTDLSNISLGVEDVIKIKNIFMSSSFTTDPLVIDLDIKDRYDLDNGQRDSYYDIASIKLKRGVQAPTGKIAIVFDYFEHSNTGKYFSVDSYPVPLKDIPVYISRDASQSYHLADVLDFRPTKNNLNQFKEKLSYIPEGDILVVYDYFLHRNDKIVLLPDGNFKVIKGVSSLTPSFPDSPVDGMVLVEIELPAITKDVKRVVITHKNNRRYTMSDIGKIEKRVENVEYYTTLNLLETSTESLVLKDADGNDRFKNGFLVDNFRGHSVGDTTNPDYACAVDPKRGELRPQFVERSVDLIETKPYENNTLGFETNISDIERQSSGYVKKGDILMLDYDTVVSVSQRVASSVININPFEVINYIGSVKITPDSDEFKSSEILEDSIVNFDTGLADALSDLSKGLGTVYTKDSTQFTTATTGVQETVEAVQSPVFPGPAYGVTGEPNETMLFLNRKIKDASDLQRRERDLTILQGELKSTSDKKARQGIQQKIKKLENSIKSAKRILNTQAPAKQNTYPRLEATSTKTITGKQTSAKGGVKLNVTQNTVQTSLGDSVKEIAFAEYCRSQVVRFELSGFKPGSRIYAFVDKVPVSHLSIQENVAQTITMPRTERQINSSSFYIDQSSSNFPRVVGASGSVVSNLVFDPVLNNGANNYPLIVNDFGRLSGYIYLSDSNPIITETGTYLENSDKNVKFKTGTKIIQFTDSINNIDSESTTSASGKFEVKGLIEKKQNTIISSKGATVSTEYDNFEKIISTSNEVDYKLNKLCWVDPVAETINITEQGGVFLTGVTLYFRNKPHLGQGGSSVNFRTRTGTPQQPVPVSVEIRETIAGVPGPRLVPGSKTYLQPNQVVINEVENDTQQDIGQLWISVPNPVDPTNVLDSSHIHYGPFTDFASDGANEPNWNPKTRQLSGLTNGTLNVGLCGTYFEFEYPVYLQEKSEYAVVVMANCIDYDVYKATIAERIVGKADIIQSTASYNGVLLKSTNSSTWTPDQSSDLTFKLHKAEFDTNNQGVVTFVNEDIPFDKLESNPFKIEQGSNVIKVFHKNHGMKNRKNPSAQKPRVKISGATGFGGVNSNFINTELSSSVKKYHDVNVLDFDSYSIEITYANNMPVSFDTTTYKTGGNSVFASKDIQVDELQVLVNDLVFDNTSIDYAYRISSGSSLHSTDYEPYVLPNTADFEDVSANERVIFESPQSIGSVANEGKFTLNDPLITGIMTTPGNVEGSSKSLFLTAALSTSNKNLSPIIDLTKTTALAIGNKVSDPGLDNEFKSYTEPTDFVFFGFEQIFTNIVVTNTNTLTLPNTNDFHIDCYVMVDDGTIKNLRKVINKTVTTLTLDKVLTVTANSTVSTSALDIYRFGDENTQILDNVTLDISGQSFSTTNKTLISLLNEVFPGGLISITDGISTVTSRVLSINRTTSTDITFNVEANLGTAFTNGTISNLDLFIQRDVITVIGSGSSYTRARSIGKSVLASMQSGQFLKVVNTQENDGTHEISNIVEVLDDSLGQSYKLNIFVKYDIDIELPNNITILGIEDFYSAESPVQGTAPCKYLTKRVVLRHPATALTVRFLGNVQEGQDVEVYVKLSGSDDISTFDNNRYIQVRPQTNKIPPASRNSDTFNEFTFESNLLSPFTTFSVKLVLKGNNSSKPVRIKDLQVIALDS